MTSSRYLPRSSRPLGARRTSRLLVGLWVSLALALLPFGPASTLTASAATAVPAVPADLPEEIEALASYVPANSCTPTARPGTVRLGNLLTSTYPNTTFGGARACGSLPDSEHHDGRAVDWMNSIRNPTQAAQAEALLEWLFATDEAGNEYADARRLGVMYVIWDGKIWGAYRAGDGWRDYSTCAEHPEKSWDNTCHRNHMHLSLSWAGAMGNTSYWAHEVAAPDFGRCRPADLNWAYGYKGPNPTPCPRYATVKPPKGASTLLKTLTLYSGRPLKKGSKGAAVTAVQSALGIKPSGGFGTGTEGAVRKFQTAHDLPVTGTVNFATWRALLQAKAPR